MKTELYKIEGLWRGWLAIVPRPRGGDWLEDEIRSWREAGIDVLVSLLTRDEIAELDIEREEELCRAHEIEYVSFPIKDRGVPSSRTAMLEMVKNLGKLLAAGKNIALHCRIGIGRSALLAACLLVHSGMDPEKAFQCVSAARGCPVPETAEQKEWVTQFARGLLAPI